MTVLSFICYRAINWITIHFHQVIIVLFYILLPFFFDHILQMFVVSTQKIY